MNHNKNNIYQDITELSKYIERLEKNKVKSNTEKIIHKLNESDKYEYKELIKKIESDFDYFFDNDLNQIRFYLTLINFTRNKNNDIEIIIKLFGSSLKIMNNLSKLRERNHVLVEITQSLLNTKDDFDKSNLVREITKTINKISEEGDPDLNWIIKDIKAVLIKSEYKKFLEDIKYQEKNNKEGELF